jgi:hypothetical protein
MDRELFGLRGRRNGGLDGWVGVEREIDGGVGGMRGRREDWTELEDWDDG